MAAATSALSVFKTPSLRFFLRELLPAGVNSAA